ncbi:hypothetical protein Acr_00g0051370 [Actinidia rufa]|uniref:Uncharacterized protein n=1 Tax=Actinidia rufa TaxID=165716 RepID=A0A7J0DKY9_9ERIC|nr:hypothetical protein Acr_00g0051370 [Actinidia rufa]
MSSSMRSTEVEHYCGKNLGRATNSQYCSVSSVLGLRHLKGDLHRQTKVNSWGEAAQNPFGVAIRPRQVMGRVHGSQRDLWKDEYGKISRRCRRHNWGDCHLERFWWRLIKPSILPRPRARRRQLFGSGRADEYSDSDYGELSGDDLARFHGLVLLRSRGFGEATFGEIMGDQFCDGDRLTYLPWSVENLSHISSPPTRNVEEDRGIYE